MATGVASAKEQEQATMSTEAVASALPLTTKVVAAIAATTGKYQVAKRSAEPVQLPNEDSIELPLSCVSHQAVERGPRVFRSGHAVDVLSGDCQTTVLRIFPEFAQLHFGVLMAVGGADTGVNRNALN